jgi:uncharacterized membrane protein YphA (DoxX/SURF4 family)
MVLAMVSLSVNRAWGFIGRQPLSISAPSVRRRNRRAKMKANKTLWTIQGLLAALFLFAGAMKLALPIEAMAGPVALPGPFLRFIGVAEVLGGLGLVLPWLLKIRPVLTPVAAVALVVIMIGAVVITSIGGSAAGAVVPLAVGVALSAVAYGRASAFATN